MRKFLLLVLCVLMVAGGLYLLAAELLWARRIYFLAIFGGAMLVTLGVYLLWADFIAAPFGSKAEQ